jgi:hypothetical protein
MPDTVAQAPAQMSTSTGTCQNYNGLNTDLREITPEPSLLVVTRTREG